MAGETWRRNILVPRKKNTADIEVCELLLSSVFICVFIFANGINSRIVTAPFCMKQVPVSGTKNSRFHKTPHTCKALSQFELCSAQRVGGGVEDYEKKEDVKGRLGREVRNQGDRKGNR